jgi:hypothetical protein
MKIAYTKSVEVVAQPDVLVCGIGCAGTAAAIAAARTAALADEGGVALDAALRQHGAPAREIKAQPIRWIQRRPGQPKATS